MKHKLSVITILLLFFVLAQIIGLSLIAYDATTVYQPDTNITAVSFSETAAGPRPELSGVGTIIYLVVGIGIATLLLLGLIKLKLGGKIWKVWYFLAITTALTIALGVFLPATIAVVLAIIFALFKLLQHNFYIHNFTEILMYAGLAILLAPLLTVFWTIVLLLIISLYDAYAVWKSKHMVALAQFTSKQNLFAGLAITYTETTQAKKISLAPLKKTSNKNSNKTIIPQQKQAILGGGDIVFPLLFTGTILISLLTQGYSKISAFLLSMIVVVGITLSLAGLFFKGKKDKFYPAMPFLTIGCLAGYGMLLLVLLFL